MKAFFLLFLGLMFTGFGCIPGENPPTRVVEAIEVCRPDAKTVSFHRPDKVKRLLHYLRQMDLCPVSQPDAPQSPEYTLTLLLSDGTNRRYRIRADRCLPPAASAWQAMNGWSAQRLPCLLAAIPPD